MCEAHISVVDIHLLLTILFMRFSSFTKQLHSCWLSFPFSRNNLLLLLLYLNQIALLRDAFPTFASLPKTVPLWGSLFRHIFKVSIVSANASHPMFKSNFPLYSGEDPIIEQRKIPTGEHLFVWRLTNSSSGDPTGYEYICKTPFWQVRTLASSQRQNYSFWSFCFFKRGESYANQLQQPLRRTAPGNVWHPWTDQLPSPDGRVLQSFLIHCFIFSFLTTERWSVCHAWIPVRPAPGAASGKNLTSSLSFLWNKPKTISMWEHPGPRRSATWFKRNSFRFQSSEFWNCPLNANRFWTIVRYFYAWILTLPTS